MRKSSKSSTTPALTLTLTPTPKRRLLWQAPYLGSLDTSPNNGREATQGGVDLRLTKNWS